MNIETLLQKIEKDLKDSRCVYQYLTANHLNRLSEMKEDVKKRRDYAENKDILKTRYTESCKDFNTILNAVIAGLNENINTLNDLAERNADEAIGHKMYAMSLEAKDIRDKLSVGLKMTESL